MITGGTRGIGAATAIRLARSGHDLVLGYRHDADAAERTAAEVRELGAGCVTVPGDLTRSEDTAALFAAAAEVGRLSAVINNAGVTLTFGALAETPVDTIRQTIDLNLTAAVLVAREAVRTLGKEVAADGVRVVGVAPGLVDTDIHASAGDPGRIDRMAPQIPIGRAGAPTEIAEAIAWLISDQASYVTGSTLRVAGGR